MCFGCKSPKINFTHFEPKLEKAVTASYGRTNKVILIGDFNINYVDNNKKIQIKLHSTHCYSKKRLPIQIFV